MTKDKPPQDLSASICEEALNNFSGSDDSLAGLIENSHIEVRDFMILSFICDQDTLSVEQLVSALGLSRQTTIDCVSRLVHADLAEPEAAGNSASSPNRVVATASGRTLARRILGP